MKTLIISDTHLGKRFEPQKLDYLLKIINQADKVIIAGDFWEGYQLTFNQFLNSPWNSVFASLKEKHCAYVTGNHDLTKWVDQDKAQIFCDTVVEEYELKVGEQRAMVLHGHTKAPSLEQIIKSLAKRAIIGPAIWVEGFLVKLFGKKLFRLYHLGNLKIMSWKKHLLRDDVILIAGHTHCQFHQGNYYNLGLIRHGIAQYAWIEDDTISLVNESYN